MLPTTYTELFIFLVGAVGAALFMGTGAALLQFRRTGSFPGERPQESDEQVAPTAHSRVRGALMRCLLGLAVLGLAVAWLARVRA